MNNYTVQTVKFGYIIFVSYYIERKSKNITEKKNKLLTIKFKKLW